MNEYNPTIVELISRLDKVWLWVESVMACDTIIEYDSPNKRVVELRFNDGSYIIRSQFQNVIVYDFFRPSGLMWLSIRSPK